MVRWLQVTNINDEKFKEYRKRKILKYLIILFCLFTIFLEGLALFKVISYIWGLIPFIITYIIKYFYVKNDFKVNKKNKVKNEISREK